MGSVGNLMTPETRDALLAIMMEVGKNLGDLTSEAVLADFLEENGMLERANRIREGYVVNVISAMNEELHSGQEDSRRDSA